MEILEEKKLSILRRYYVEASIIVLGLSVFSTIVFAVKLNDRFMDYVMKDGKQNAETISKSNDVIQRNSEVINGNTDAIKENTKALSEFNAKKK